MYGARESLLLEYTHLREGESRAGELCPQCQGGESKEKSLSVSRRDGSLKWICFRASCSFRGSERGQYQSSGGIPTEATDVRGVWGRQLCRTAVRVPQGIRDILRERYCITERHVAKFGIGWDQEKERLVIPVLGLNQEERGAVLRSVDTDVTKQKGAKPKSLTHIEKDSLSWHITTSGSTESLCIVEDQFSSIRSSDYLNSVALLGTHLNDERVYELKQFGASKYYLCLDADAWDKTVKYCLKYKSILRMIPIKLERDIKDQSPEQLQELLGNL